MMSVSLAPTATNVTTVAADTLPVRARATQDDRAGELLYEAAGSAQSMDMLTPVLILNLMVMLKKRKDGRSQEALKGKYQSPMPFVPTLPFSFMTKEETEAFFAAIPVGKVRDRLLFDVIYHHSLRRGEAVLIRLEHIKRGARGWDIGITRLKRGESRYYPVFPSTKRYLRAFLRQRGQDDNPYLFPSRQRPGQSITGATIYALLPALRGSGRPASASLSSAHPSAHVPHASVERGR